MNNFEEIEDYTNRYKSEVNIINYNDNGFGDILNRLSYLYTTSLNYKKLTTVKWSYSEVDYNKVINAEEFLKPCQFIRNEKRPEIKKPWDENKYTLYNHEYWPTKNSKTKIKTNKIAIDIYVYFNPGRSVINRFKVSSKAFKEILSDTIRDNNYEPVEVFHIDGERGSTNIITDYRDLLSVNSKILESVDAYVGVEGNISHMCRAMKIPSLVLYNMLNSKPPAVQINNNVLTKIVAPYVDEKIQTLVTSEELLLKEIPSFLKKIS